LARRIDVRGGNALLVSGWGVDRRRDAPIEQVVITDDDGVIVGMGVAVRRTAELPEGSLPAQDYPWIGFIRGSVATGPHSAFGLLDEGRIACPLGLVRPGAGRGVR
jgi:hypothetical protein